MNTKQIKILSISSILLSVVAIALVASHYVFAAITDGDFVHACVKNNNGSVRIIDPTDSCTSSEIGMTWNKNGVNDFGGYTTKVFNNMDFQSDNLSYRNFEGAIFNGVIMDSSVMSKYMDFKNATLNQAYIQGSDMLGSNFSNIKINNSRIEGSSFTDVNFSGAIIKDSNFDGAQFLNTNLTNVAFINTNLANSIQMNTAIRTGVTYSNTICPDGTNSDANGNTCEGHF